jgi:hypothetical protein
VQVFLPGIGEDWLIDAACLLGFPEMTNFSWVTTTKPVSTSWSSRRSVSSRFVFQTHPPPRCQCLWRWSAAKTLRWFFASLIIVVASSVWAKSFSLSQIAHSVTLRFFDHHDARKPRNRKHDSSVWLGEYLGITVARPEMARTCCSAPPAVAVAV